MLFMASDYHFNVGWANALKEGDFLTFTLVGDGLFRVKRNDVGTGVPHQRTVKDADDIPDGHVVDSSDEYQSSEPETESSDGSEYVDDHGAFDVDGCPTFSVTITNSHLAGTFEIPFGFWNHYIRIGALQAPIYFVHRENTSTITLGYSNSKIWIAHGWKHFSRANQLLLGDRCNFKLVDGDDVTFYVWFDRA
ncbi:hypothetical protein SASPL_151352 [Salvia splendens]|uniref:TF-B3 domain-containing protein n=1 Tax=Salvia splendens TaxID=180675 RepID=A0A8X8Z2L1_SALSN|nr:hypothetical protein SASPL_151352 [Salvia splendens]